MSIKINVSYNQKERAKSLGANWNPKEKTWYIPTETKDLSPFIEWLEPADYYLIPVHSFVLEGTNKCWVCNKITSVVTLASATYRTLNKNYQLVYSNKLVVFDRIKNIEDNTLANMNSICPNYQFRFSQTIKDEYWMNRCEHCKAPIGDHFLFNEMNGPFMDPLYSLKKGYLKVHKLNEIFDIPISADIGTHVGINKSKFFLTLASK